MYTVCLFSYYYYYLCCIFYILSIIYVTIYVSIYIVFFINWENSINLWILILFIELLIIIEYLYLKRYKKFKNWFYFLKDN